MRRFNITKVYFGASRTYGIYAQLRAHAHARRARTRTAKSTYATVVGGGLGGTQNVNTQ